MIAPHQVEEAFTAAGITALEELLGVNATSQPHTHGDSAWLVGEIVCAQIDLMRDEPGKMLLLLSAETAAQLAKRYLPSGAALSHAMIDDVAGEFANVIAGQAKTMLKGTPDHFGLSTPQVSRRQVTPEWISTDRQTVLVELTCEFGFIKIAANLP